MSVFTDVSEPSEYNPTQSLYGKSLLDNVSSVKIGTGSTSFKADPSGIWLGANTFADAPFRVSMEGEVRIKDDLSTTIIDSTGMVTDAVIGNNSDTSVWNGSFSITSTSGTTLTNLELEIELRRSANIIFIADVYALYSGGNRFEVVPHIAKYNYGTDSYDTSVGQGSCMVFYAFGILPYKQSFATVYGLANDRTAGLPQKYKITLKGNVYSSGTATLYSSNIAYIKLNG